MRKLKVTELGRLNIDEYKQTEKVPLIIVLDNIRSIYNVGSVFRTADAFKIEKIVLCGITAVPPMLEIHKTALGAEDSVEWTYYEDTLKAIQELKELSYQLMAIEQVENSLPLHQWTLENEKKYAFILGNEVKGVRQDVVDACHHSIEIPQFGTKHSLNIANAAAIVMWEFMKQHLSISCP